jgi:hypothetical protein
MKATLRAKITEVQKRVSNQGNLYFEVSFTEELSVLDESGKPIPRQWNKVFYKPEDTAINPMKLVEDYAQIQINFYSFDKRVGDKTYTEIRANIINIEKIV